MRRRLDRGEFEGPGIHLGTQCNRWSRPAAIKNCDYGRRRFGRGDKLGKAKSLQRILKVRLRLELLLPQLGILMQERVGVLYRLGHRRNCGR